MTLAAGPPANALLVMSELDLAGNKIELVNTGTSTASLSGRWWCNRVNGDPVYGRVAATSSIDLALSTATSLLAIEPGEILVLALPAGLLPDANGELGLYSSSRFGTSSAIEDYILWGSPGFRDGVAEAAGIWIDDDAVDVAGMGPGETIQLGLGLAGDAASDYFVGAGTLGVAQSIPEPGSAGLVLLGLLFMARGRPRCLGTNPPPGAQDRR